MRGTVGVRGCSAAVVVAVSLGGLVACSADREKPDATALVLARGLSALDVSSVPFRDATAAQAGQQLSTAVAGMDGLRPTVRVRSTRAAADGNTATAVLAVTWDVDDTDQDWTYPTEAHLTYGKESWSVDWSPAELEPSLTAGERLVLRRTAAQRGEILGAGGAVLVTDRPVVRIGIDKTRVAPAQAPSSAGSLAKLLGVEPAAFVQRVTAAGPKAFVEALVVRVDAADAPDKQKVAAIPGAAEVPDTLPLAPTREFARPVLGSVGEATAELVAGSGGRLYPPRHAEEILATTTAKTA